MTPSHALAYLDALALIGAALCALVIKQRDFNGAHWSVRATTATFGIACYSQAMWLLGAWEPGPAGFPWQRAILDGSLFLASFTRVLFPLRAVAPSAPPQKIAPADEGQGRFRRVAV